MLNCWCITYPLGFRSLNKENIIRSGRNENLHAAVDSIRGKVTQEVTAGLLSSEEIKPSAYVKGLTAFIYRANTGG